MALRAGRAEEHELKFLDEQRAFLTWEDLTDDLTKIDSRDEVAEVLRRTYPDAGEGVIRNPLSQIRAFAKTIEVGDWFATPSKFSNTGNGNREGA